MKNLKSKVAALALTAGVGIGVFATTVNAAGPNDGGTNCHGVWMSYLSTSGMAPGRLHKDFGASVQDVNGLVSVLVGGHRRSSLVAIESPRV